LARATHSEIAWSRLLVFAAGAADAVAPANATAEHSASKPSHVVLRLVIVSSIVLPECLHSDITVNDRALEDDQHNAIIAVKVAGFPPHANLARLLTVRTAFTDLTLPAYLKRTNFGPVTNRVQKYRCIDEKKIKIDLLCLSFRIENWS
jgi:hypothetical protein